MKHPEDPNCVTDDLTGKTYSTDYLAEFEFAEQWLRREPELASQSLNSFDEARTLDRYADDTDSSDSDCY